MERGGGGCSPIGSVLSRSTSQLTPHCFNISRSLLSDEGKRVHVVTGSPFDRTPAIHASIDRPGTHGPLRSPVDTTAFSRTGRPTTSSRPNPKAFLPRGTGFGGAAATLTSTASSLGSPLRPATAIARLSHTSTLLHSTGSLEATVAAVARGSPPPVSSASVSGPPSADSTKARHNPPNTELRRFYERGDLPCFLDFAHFKGTLAWKVPVEKLDLAYYLPIFVDGLREEEQPYKYIARQGVSDIIDHGGAALLPVIPLIIPAFKIALNTRRHGVLINCLDALRKLVLSDARGGGPALIARALVPYYRQLLPVLNIFLLTNKNLGDRTDYAQRKNDVLGDRIEELLGLFETYGGEDAFINIKYLIPTYQSCLTRK